MSALTYPGTFLPGEENSFFSLEPFGLSLYQPEGVETSLKDEDLFSSSFCFNNASAPLDWSSFSAPFSSELDIFEFGPPGEALLDTPTSSFPSSPISSFSTSSNLSPPEQQEVNDIISSLKDTTPADVCYTPSLSSSPNSSPPLSPFPVAPTLPPQKKFHEETAFIPPPALKRPPQQQSRIVKGGRAKISKTEKKERKKEQNKTAAIRYRQKKKDELDCLSRQEMSLLESNKKLKEQVNSLAAEVDCLKRLWSDVCKAKGVSPRFPLNI